MSPITDLTKALNEAASALPAQGPISDEERNGFFIAYENLKRKIETPIDAAVRILFGGYDAVALEIAMDTQLLNQLALAQGGKKSVAELCEPCSADPVLINRILRLLSASGLVQEVGEGEYAATALTPAFSDMSPLSKSVSHITHCSEPLVKLPQFLKQTKWKNPDDGWNGPFQYAMGTKDQYFEWLHHNPKEQESFNTHMQLQRMERGPDWFSFYPIEERLLQHDGHPSRPFLVDVGGGVGHDLAAFSANFPQLAPRLVLEDQPHVLAEVDRQDFKLDGVQRVSVDFFKEQPVKGAKVYYLRTILHDWPDKQAKRILEHIREAMDDDSVLLLNENALPDEKVSGFQARADLMMMALLSGIDRSLKQFKALLEESGFQVGGVWRPEVAAPGAGTIFEAKKGPSLNETV